VLTVVDSGPDAHGRLQLPVDAERVRERTRKAVDAKLLYRVRVAYDMSTVRSKVRDPTVIAGLGGVGYAAGVLSYMVSRGVYLSFESVGSVVIGIGYAVGGLILMAAVPLYLLARFSVVSPAGTTVWLLGNTVYQDLYGAHLHPLTSYLAVWPLLFGVAIGAGLSEALIRLATERTLDRGGFRRLV
jgi:hypothetical protein